MEKANTNLNITFRDMRAEDAPALYQIECEAFAKPWSISSLTALACAPNALARVALSGGEIVGYYSLYRSFEEGDINNIAVRKDMRGCGIGSLLIKDMLEECKKQGIDRLFLEVRASNSPAISLYEKFSFRQFSVRKKYYDGEEDALLYAVLL